MEYTVGYCDELMDQQLDKLGSDLFPLPIKLMQFRKSTYDFIRETLTYFEATQEISDDLKSLLKYQTVPMVRHNYKGEWNAIDPEDYHRLITAEPYYEEGTDTIPLNKGGVGAPVSEGNEPKGKQSFAQPDPYIDYHTKYKTIRIIKVGQIMAYKRDPFKKPTHEYPTVQRLQNLIRFDFGSDDGTRYRQAIISYIKEPNFGFDESTFFNNQGLLPSVNYSNLIVDLAPIAILKIIDRTCSSLRFSSGSPEARANYEFAQTFGKRNR